jgi:hypothetical protein
MESPGKSLRFLKVLGKISCGPGKFLEFLPQKTCLAPLIPAINCVYGVPYTDTRCAAIGKKTDEHAVVIQLLDAKLLEMKNCEVEVFFLWTGHCILCTE